LAAGPINGSARVSRAVRPLPAATLILIDRSGRVPKVLMGRRHAGHSFMPDKYVFPGGRVDPQDRRMPVAGALPAIVEEKLLKRISRPSPGRARAQALAAIRETFEETGLLLGSRDFGSPLGAPPGSWSEFAAQGVFPSLENLHFVARAITPPHFHRRYDTAFFCADARDVAAEVSGRVGPSSELVEIVWIALREARGLDMIDITGFVLDEVQSRMGLGMRHDLPVPFYHGPVGRRIRDEL
jgi:8-oxo-dGTP pyrophosphatase MutT (NUDIX family)